MKHAGKAVVVTDDEILAAQKTLASGSGLFAEPSSCTAFAGWDQGAGQHCRARKVACC
jgi:threonine synthase